MAVKRVIVEIDLGVEREQASIGSGDKRINLGQRGVRLFAGAVKRRHQLHRPRDFCGLQSEAESQPARLKGE